MVVFKYLLLSFLVFDVLFAQGESHANFSESLLERGSQEIKFWVFFENKGLDSEILRKKAVSSIEPKMNPRTLERRKLRGAYYRQYGQATRFEDLPIFEPYIKEVEAVGVSVLRRSRWLNAISIRGTADAIKRVTELSFVKELRPVAVGYKDYPDRGSGSKVTLDSIDYGYSQAQLEQINLIQLHQEGYMGQGVVIGVLDTGFNRTHQAFNQPGHEIQVIAEYDFVDDDGNTAYEAGDDPGQHQHGTRVLGCMAAYYPGYYIGAAPEASFVLCKTEDVTSETPVEEDNFVAGIEYAETQGVDVLTSSLGYISWYTQEDLNGQTAVTTLAVNIATSNGVFFCNAAGNDYHDSDPETSHLIAPADAFQVITCGSVASSGLIGAHSSDGPTADGRVKPEVLAMGIDTYTISPTDNSSYAPRSGTSFATPLVAGVVACLTQAHPDWSVEDMRQTLFQTAGDFIVNLAPDPLFVRGYGIVNAWYAAHTDPSDCDNNGILDSIELDLGLSTDCQPNGILDTCEVAQGLVGDINGNGVPDECESICLGDLDSNMVVDELDFNLGLGFWAQGSSVDFNGDAVFNILDLVIQRSLFGSCPP